MDLVQKSYRLNNYINTNIPTTTTNTENSAKQLWNKVKIDKESQTDLSVGKSLLMPYGWTVPSLEMRRISCL